MQEPESQSPRLSVIRMIYMREMRDQFRDRRTIFTIAVLPLLVYPLVGMLLLQIAQFTQEQPISVCFVGSEFLPDEPAIFEDDRISESLLKRTDSITVTIRDADPEHAESPEEICHNLIRDGLYDAVVFIPEDFGSWQVSTESTEQDDETANPQQLPDIQLFYSMASDQSRVAGDRMSHVMQRWRQECVKKGLLDQGIDTAVLAPFSVATTDIAPESTRRAAFWSKLLPFVMLVWALTGAFYPAIDLVAGEKERGTLETLLCSPALRGEIVWGKLGAVTSFSVMTALLNVMSMQMTATFAFHQMGLSGSDSSMGAPPLTAMLWLLLALFPLSALFSSLALAVAAMARSSKEGQYYLMPLMMVTLPLVLLPLMPGTTLNLGTCLIPVTGMFLLVRSLVESQYNEALLHLPIVAVVTGCCLHMAVRWAQRQFESEEVLFRDGEQWDLNQWMRHLLRDRQPIATTGQAILCGAVVLMALFFGKLMATQPESWADFAMAVLLPQLGMILAPMLLMATVLTTSLRSSLRLRMPPRGAMAAALLLGITLHPLYSLLGQLINRIYPMSKAMVDAIEPMFAMLNDQPFLVVVFIMAVIPAICEELTFRGFIFGGLARNRGGVRAVLITAVMFGFSHAVFQQSVAATIMGCVIGWIALRTGSVLPGIVFHVTNNTLSMAIAMSVKHPEIFDSWLGFFLRQSTESGSAPITEYQPLWIVISGSLAVALLIYVSLYDRTDADDEEIDVAERKWAQQHGSSTGRKDDSDALEVVARNVGTASSIV